MTVTATDTAGGTAEIEVTITVTTSTSTLGPLGDRYDANNNGMIDKPELITAINDYLFSEGDNRQAVSSYRSLTSISSAPSPGDLWRYTEKNSDEIGQGLRWPARRPVEFYFHQVERTPHSPAPEPFGFA